MQRLIIYKDKITTTKWDDNSKTYPEYDILKLEGSLPKYFNRVVEIKPDVTVEDFMHHLERYESIIDYCFSDYMNGLTFRHFLDDMNRPNPTKTDIGEIIMCWEGEVINDDLIMIGYLVGWLNEEKIKEIGEENAEPFDVSFLSMSIWKNCLFNLNDEISINDLGQINNIKNEMIFAGFYRWTLFELISHFFEDISINGSPEQRDKLAQEMESKKFNAKEVAQNKEQAEFWMSFLESELNDLKANMEKALEDEEYEKISKIKSSIEVIEKELFDLKEELRKNG